MLDPLKLLTAVGSSWADPVIVSAGEAVGNSLIGQVIRGNRHPGEGALGESERLPQILLLVVFQA